MQGLRSQAVLPIQRKTPMLSELLRDDAPKQTKYRRRIRRRDVRHRPTWNPVVEMLEDRIVLSSSTATWTGADHAISDNWSDVANWVGDYKPQAGDAVVFPATAVDFNPINDNPAGTIFASITIQSGDYDITGNAVELTGPLTANSNADGALY